jgi:transcriptional regulator with XRE-family HTH domain
MRLSDLHPTLTQEERVDLAARAGMSPAYLWQLATQWRGKKPSLAQLSRLAAADERLNVVDLVEEFAPVHSDGQQETVTQPGAL